MTTAVTEPAGRVLALLRRLVSCPSLTPADAGTLDIAQECLVAAGFTCERLPRDGVDNLWATHGHGAPGIVLSGHVDVVPPGATEQWQHDPFVPREVDGKLYGRGTTDMKGGVAALLIAATDFVTACGDHPGTLAMVLTSDEEGPALAGTRHVVKTLAARGEHFAYGLVGEPSSDKRFGDTLRVGRRGSLTGTLTIKGQQGHVAYPQRHKNPVPVLAALINTLSARVFAAPPGGVEPTLLQVVGVQADGGASNIVPGTATATVNFRYTPQDTPAALQLWVAGECAAAGLPFECSWTGAARPYYTGADSVLGQVVTAVATEVNGFAPAPSVGGGTSDGRFLADLCDEVVEFGTVGKTMHQVDEHVVIGELAPLVTIYARMLGRILTEASPAG